MLDRKARNLTADMKQKISLGRGLVRPDVAAILFDEPLTVIDPHLKWQLRSTLKEIHRALDLTMIYVTHDQTEALTFADKVVVMHDGAVVQTGTPDELFERPAHTFVGHFIGSPGMNVLPCRVEGATASLDEHAVPLARAYPVSAGSQGIELGMRPEFARLRRAAPGCRCGSAHRRSRPHPHRARRARRAGSSRRPSRRSFRSPATRRRSRSMRVTCTSTPTAICVDGRPVSPVAAREAR